MNSKEQLDQLDRAAIAADEAYQSALAAEHVPMTSRYQSALLSPHVRALKDARDAASVRRYNAAMSIERGTR
jgi:hypothetical protein